jgi:hypothetical protein
MTEEISKESWSHIQETLNMLNLAIAHIKRSMMDGDESVHALSDSFTDMVGLNKVIEKASTELEDSPEKQAINNACKQIGERTDAAIVAFQFYDILTQRLEHICQSLSAMSELFTDAERLNIPYEWSALQEKIKSKYRIQGDREMFDAILEGKSIDEALKLGVKERTAKDELEFF